VKAALGGGRRAFCRGGRGRGRGSGRRATTAVGCALGRARACPRRSSIDGPRNISRHCRNSYAFLLSNGDSRHARVASIGKKKEDKRRHGPMRGKKQVFFNFQEKVASENKRFQSVLEGQTRTISLSLPSFLALALPPPLSRAHAIIFQNTIFFSLHTGGPGTKTRTTGRNTRA